MADKRVFTIEIDGLKKAYDDSEKLFNVLTAIENENKKVSVSTDKVSKSSKERTKSLSDEEKAQKKLNDTIEKANKPITELEKEQAKANLKLKERAKLLKEEVEASNIATNSIAERKKQLKELNQEWNNIDVGSERFKELETSIKGLNEELKELEANKGVFGRNVGNYPEIDELTNSFDNLGNKIDSTSKDARGFIGLFQAGIGTAVLFDDKNNKLSKTLNSLGKIMVIIGSLQKANNLLMTKGNAQSTIAVAVSKAHTIQESLRAKAVANSAKNTTAGTVAQIAYNAAANAFPFLIFISGILAITGAIKAFSLAAGDASEKQKEYKSSIDGTIHSTEEALRQHDTHIRKVRDLQIEYKLLTGEINEYQAALMRIAEDSSQKLGEIETKYNNEREELLKKYQTSWRDNIAERRLKVLQYEEELTKLTEKENNERSQIEAEALQKTTNKVVEENNKRIEARKQLDLDLKTGLDRELAINENAREKELKSADRFGLDKDKINQKYAAKEAEIKETYNKQAQAESKKRQDEEKRQADELRKLRNDIIAERIKQIEDAEEREIITIQNEYRKRLETITGFSEEETELRKALAENQEKAVADIREKYRTKRERDEVNDQKTLLDIQKSQIDNFYKEIQDSYKNSYVFNNGIIDVNETKKNLESVNKTLVEYLNRLSVQEKETADYYDNLLSFYETDSIEYKKIQNEKENALRDFSDRAKDVNGQIEDNTRESTDLQKIYWRQLYDELQKYVSAVSEATTAIFDAAGSILSAQLDDANEKYEKISAQYDAIVEKREESSARIEALEEKAATARGGRSISLQQQISAEMEANKQLASQEQQLAKEKERQEKLIAKREKQAKKAQMTQNLIEGIGNTALGVTKALSSTSPPLNFVLAGLVGAAGAVQTGVISSQLSKLEDGGLLNGKRHANGGMRVEGTNIEVEGGEYVVNRQSTAKNIDLINWINSQRREITGSDLSAFFSKTYKAYEPPFKRRFENGGQLPVIDKTVNFDTQLLAEAIKGINIEPRVSVVDINTVQNEAVKVDDIAGI